MADRNIYAGLARHGSAGVRAVGLIKLVEQGNVQSGEFAYGLRYLKDAQAQPLNPLHLPLREEPFALREGRLRDGGALPLTFRDALPDTWGRKVLQVLHGPLSDVEALLLTNEDRVGALVFSEAVPMRVNAPALDHPSLDQLAEAARRVEAGMDVPPAMQRLLSGGSLGGARPKASFVHQGRRYLAKFSSRGDDHAVEVLEAATLSLARACAVSTPDHFLQPLAKGAHALLLERFDRTGPIGAEFRFHYLSAAALLDAPYESSLGSYAELALVLRRISAKPEEDLLDLYRRLIFNLAVGNTDDHVKNHGMLLRAPGQWRLAPAFDLVPQLDANVGVQGLAIVPGKHESSLALAREAAPAFGLRDDEAAQIARPILEQVQRDMYGNVRASGGTDALAKRAKAYVTAQRERIA